MKYYIAYGSNLNLTQMGHRCPTATIYGTGYIDNWELIYRGTMSNSHATIRRKKGSRVPILMWAIEDRDERMLDIYEGYPKYYVKQDIMAYINGRKKKAMVYIMDPSRKPGKPADSYVHTIYQGYLDNDLDLEYFYQSLRLNDMEV